LLLERAAKDPEVVTFFFKEGHDEAVDVEGMKETNEQGRHSNLPPETANEARNTSRDRGNLTQVPAKTKSSPETGSGPEIMYYIAISILLGLGLLTGAQYLQSVTAKAHLARYQTGG